MTGVGTWRQWTLRDLLLAPVLVACALATLRGETPGVIGLALGGAGLSVALVTTAMMVAKSVTRLRRSGLRITITGPDFGKSPSLETGDGRPITAIIASRKAMAAIALAAIMFPLWMAVENELVRAATAGAWLVPPLALAVLLMIVFRIRRLSLHRVPPAQRSQE